MLRKTALGIIWFLLLVQMSRAEVINEYAPILVDTKNPGFMALVGPIDGRTALNFERAIDEYGVPDILVLASDGGLVYQALIIARRVRALGINTFVPDESGCYSACSMVFLGGVVRSADGELGVHQISSDSGDLESGQVSISDIIDTLDDFDVPNKLLVDMLRTPPEDMYVVPLDEKVEYGLVSPSLTAQRAPAGNVPVAVVESRAFDFVAAYQAAWSRSNGNAIDSVLSMYGPTVRFFGENWSLSQVRDDKWSFAERWPSRRYRLLGDTVSVSCDSRFCYVRGQVEWAVSSSARSASAAGVSFTDLKLEQVGESFVIVSEDGRVVRRD